MGDGGRRITKVVCTPYRNGAAKSVTRDYLCRRQTPGQRLHTRTVESAWTAANSLGSLGAVVARRTEDGLRGVARTVKAWRKVGVTSGMRVYGVTSYASPARPRLTRRARFTVAGCNAKTTALTCPPQPSWSLLGARRARVRAVAKLLEGHVFHCGVAWRGHRCQMSSADVMRFIVVRSSISYVIHCGVAWRGRPRMS